MVSQLPPGGATVPRARFVTGGEYRLLASGKLWRARSRLYQRRFLRPNTHFKAFFEIYKICNPLHLWILCTAQISKVQQKLGKLFSYFAQNLNFCKNRSFQHVFIENCTDFDEIFSEFRRMVLKMLKYFEISEFLMDSSKFTLILAEL